jgi:putative ABC transport system permease protein
LAGWVAAIRYACRTLRRQPTFTCIALLTLALGIGANTAIFSVVKAVVLNPLPYQDPERLVVLWEVNPDGALDRVSIPTFEDWKRETRTLEAIAAYSQVDFTFAGAGTPENVSVVKATPELFAVLKADTAIGRRFRTDEAIVGTDRVAVISHGFWERVFGARLDIVGSTIQLNAEPYTVVGVMPAGFEFPTSTAVEIWTPLAFDPRDVHARSRRVRALTVVGRLAPSATLLQAQAELSLLSRRIASENPASNDEWMAKVVAAHEQLVASSRPALMVLMGAVGFLLLIVCANMANLLLARLSDRRRELAVRGALGAGTWEISQPILAESLVLSVLGGVVGLLTAAGGLRLLALLPEVRLPRAELIQLDAGVLLFTTVVSLVVGLTFAVLPAFHASRARLREALTEAAGATPSLYARRVLSGLVVAEVAMALVLLVGAGLMTRSFAKLLQVDPGFTPGNLVAAQVFLPPTKYRERHRLAQFFEDVVALIRAEPGVRAAAAVSALPLHDVGTTSALPFTIEGQAPPRTEDPIAEVRTVAPGYFETMRMTLRAGRFLDERDGAEAARASVINETMAHRYFPDRNPIGQVIQNPHGKSVIVGVVADVRSQGLNSEPRKQVYLPLRQNPVAGMAVVARAEKDPQAVAGVLQRMIWRVDSQQAIYDLSTMDQILARTVFLPRLSATLLSLFALAALLLAALGLYGVLSYSVTQRTREIGLRMALGASSGSTVGLVIRNSLILIAVGVGLGLAAAIVLARSMTGILYGVGPFDLPSFAVAVLVLASVGVGASLLPARHATRVDPIVALRDEASRVS